MKHKFLKHCHSVSSSNFTLGGNHLFLPSPFLPTKALTEMHNAFPELHICDQYYISIQQLIRPTKFGKTTEVMLSNIQSNINFPNQKSVSTWLPPSLTDVTNLNIKYWNVNIYTFITILLAKNYNWKESKTTESASEGSSPTPQRVTFPRSNRIWKSFSLVPKTLLPMAIFSNLKTLIECMGRSWGSLLKLPAGIILAVSSIQASTWLILPNLNKSFHQSIGMHIACKLKAYTYGICFLRIIDKGIRIVCIFITYPAAVLVNIHSAMSQ